MKGSTKKGKLSKADPYFHPAAIIESKKVGRRTRIWAFAHVLPGAKIGRDCNICDGVFIEDKVVLGDRVTVKSGVQLWDGLIVESDVFIGPNATFTNDPFPRSKKHLSRHAQTYLRTGCSVGANATILPGLEIGQGAMVGAGAVVTHSVPAQAIVMGNPARICGYVNSHSRLPVKPVSTKPPNRITSTGCKVIGVRLIQLNKVSDIRGALVAGEVGQGMPFVPRRFFVIHDVPSNRIRGEHAHRHCDQLLVCLQGACSVSVDDGNRRAHFRLDRPETALLIPAMIWATQFDHTHDAVLLVMASNKYNASDYIRKYTEFLGLVHRKKSP